MADNILTKDRDDADIAIAAKDLAGVLVPRNMLVDAAGADVTPLTDAALRASAVPVSLASVPLPSGAATQATLAALNVIAAAVQSAVDAINGKTTACNTGAIAGTVALDAPTLAALESITASTGGLTDAELRAAAVPVSASALPLPTGAATEATIATLAGVVKIEDTPSTDGDPGFVILAQRRDTDAPSAGTDGDYTTLKMDEAGRLKVASQPAAYAVTVGNVTSATSSIPVNTERFSNLMAHCAGTFAGANCTFEGSLNSTNGTDGAWFAVQAIRSNANTIETATGVLAAAPAYAWELSVNALKWFRIRATAWTSGTQVWTMVPGTYATEPIPGAQVSGTQPVSGTVTATPGAGTARMGFIAGAGIWYDDSAVVLAGAATFTGTSRDATVTATATAFANAATYAMEVRISAESDQSGTLWLETSRDNTNWRRVKAVPTAAVTGGGQFAEIVHRPSWRYWRAGFTNGATLQTRFSINSLAIAA